MRSLRNTTLARRNGSLGPATTRHGRPGSRVRLRFKHGALSPLLLFFLVLVLYPLSELFRLAFSTVTLSGGVFTTQFNGLANFHRMLDDGFFWNAMRNTVVFVFGATAAQLVLGTWLALMVDRSRVFRVVAKNVLIWPAIITPVAISVIWWLILNIEFGLLNHILDVLGLPTQTWLGSTTWALPAVMVVDVWHWTPVVFLFVLAGLANIDRTLYEAARIDGASERSVFWHVTLPLLVPTLVMASAIRVMLGFKVFDEIFVLTDGGPGISTEVISTYIREIFVEQSDFGYGAFLSVSVMVMVLALVTIYVFLFYGVPKILRAIR